MSQGDTIRLIQNLAWNTMDLPPVVYEILAMVVYWRRTGGYSPDATLEGLMPAERLRTEGIITEHAESLLEQARLVYINFQSSSLHFVLAIIDQIHDYVGDNFPALNNEVEAFRQIAPLVRSSPFCGLRMKIPEVQQVQQYPMLAYGGLLYHQLLIRRTPEAETFREYKVDEIKRHIVEVNNQRLVEGLIAVLPSATTAALSTLVQGMSLDTAQSLMATRSEEERTQVLERLRRAEIKGQWEEDLIAKEDAGYTRELIATGVNRLKEALETKYNRLIMESNLIADLMARTARVQQVNN